MRPEPFYVSPDRIHGDRLVLDKEERRHLVTVKRHRAGDAVTVVDGVGGLYGATIEEIRPDEVVCHITTTTRVKESVSIVLGVGILKNPARLDYLVEKSTELGVSEIVLLETERTISGRLKTDRWNNLALAAMKQSGRAYLPRVTLPVPFHEFLRDKSNEVLGVIPHEKLETPTLPQVLTRERRRSIRICIGPEGGFSDREFQEAEEAGYQGVSLGVNRLRTETAAVVAVAYCVEGISRQ